MPPQDKTDPISKRQSLLANLRRTHESQKPVSAPRPAKVAQLTESYDFSEHPAYSEVRIAKAASQTLGVRSPFFRVAEAVRGVELKIDGAWVRNFASYDYLGLNNSKDLHKSVKDAATEWGVSATASRLVGGERRLHGELENRLSRFIGTDAALVFVSGHATNVALVSTLVGPNDLVLVDALAHNSIYEGIRASGAAHTTFPHNNYAWVDKQLTEQRDRYANVLVIVEGLYSMDGDTPDLEQFVDVKNRHNAWLMVDEAHSMGVLGKHGRGITEEKNVRPEHVEVIMGTLSKSFCSCGGYVAGSEALIDLMRYRAPGFVYSVGLSAPNTAAAIAAVDRINAEPDRVERLRSVGQKFRELAIGLGLDTGESQGYAVCPVIVGDSLKAVWMSNRLLEAGFNVLPIISPAVPDKSARLRFFLTSEHSASDLQSVLQETAKLRNQAKSLTIAEMANG